MDFTHIILLIFFASKNAARARMKDQNAYLWGFLTILLFFIFEMIGTMFVLVLFCKDLLKYLIQLSASVNPLSGREQFNQRFVEAMAANPLHMITIMLFGMAGYLIVRYILERKPNKRGPTMQMFDQSGDID